jgi:hypothetical protein
LLVGEKRIGGRAGVPDNEEQKKERDISLALNAHDDQDGAPPGEPGNCRLWSRPENSNDPFEGEGPEFTLRITTKTNQMQKGIRG